jgi:RNA polymerase sigma-70 factor (ECF subfamily)
VEHAVVMQVARERSSPGPPRPVPAPTSSTPTRLVGEDDLRAAYRLHGAEIFGLAVRQLGDRGLAEEVTQDVFVRAWRNRRRYDPDRASLRTWLFAIARNRIIDAARRRGVRPPVAEGRGRVEETHNPFARIDRATALAAALDRLPEDQRTALVEVHLHGRTSADVAAELGVAAGTIRARIHHALKALRTVATEQDLR